MQSLNKLKFSLDSWTTSKDHAPEETMLITCENPAAMEGFRILLGLCANRRESGGRPCHWAWAEEYHRVTWGRTWTKVAHDCATDHVEQWNDMAREFGNEERTVRLVFKRCPHDPETLVLWLELTGNVYEEMQRDTHVSLPHPRSQPPSLPSTSTLPALTAPDPSIVPKDHPSPSSSHHRVAQCGSCNGGVQEQTKQLSDSLQYARLADIAELKESINNLNTLLAGPPHSPDPQPARPATTGATAPDGPPSPAKSKRWAPRWLLRLVHSMAT